MQHRLEVLLSMDFFLWDLFFLLSSKVFFSMSKIESRSDLRLNYLACSKTLSDNLKNLLVLDETRVVGAK